MVDACEVLPRSGTLGERKMAPRCVTLPRTTSPLSSRIRRILAAVNSQASRDDSMLSLSTSTRIFLCREAVDFRKAHDGLVAVIRDQLAEDVFEGGVFVFLNKRRDRIKLIEWDCNGLWMHYKRLEQCTYRWSAPGTAIKVAMSRAELSMLLEGIDLKAGKIRPHFADQVRIKRREDEGRTTAPATRC